jgi:deoxyribose-phosphate aldolase
VSDDLLGLCDYTMLDAEGEIDIFLEDANQYDFAAICVLPEHVKMARSKYSGIIACAAGGFPHGDGPLHERISEVKRAIADGADEIDIVLDFDALMDGDRNKVATDLAQMRQACGDKILKVILETPELDLSYVELAAKLALEFGADFIKTCTGRRGGCTPLVAQVLAELLAAWSHENNGKVRGLKLSGGIREPGQAEGYLDIVRTALGDGFVHPATFRFGTSSVLESL